MRIQLELSDNSVAQIKGLMKETHIKTYSELFSYSLAILIWAVKESRKNLIIVSADESTGKAVSELALPILMSINRDTPVNREEPRAKTAEEPTKVGPARTRQPTGG